MASRVLHERELNLSFLQELDMALYYHLTLFVAIDRIMKNTKKDRKNWIQWTVLEELDDLNFAVNVAFLLRKHS